MAVASLRRERRGERSEAFPICRRSTCAFGPASKSTTLERDERFDLGYYVGLDALRIAVVDDSPYFRKIALTMLAAFGVRTVLDASTESEAWRLIETERPDLMLIDWNLGTGGNGASLVDRIRCHPDLRVSTLAVILVTAYNSRRRMLEAADLGANSLILKPVSARVLYERLSRFVGQNLLYERRPGRLRPLQRPPSGSEPVETGTRIRVPRLNVPPKSQK